VSGRWRGHPAGTRDRASAAGGPVGVAAAGSAAWSLGVVVKWVVAVLLAALVVGLALWFDDQVPVDRRPDPFGGCQQPGQVCGR